jgi:hypothetical protein
MNNTYGSANNFTNYKEHEQHLGLSQYFHQLQTEDEQHIWVSQQFHQLQTDHEQDKGVSQ